MSALLVIHEDWDFTLSAVLHSATVAVVTTTGDGQTLNGYVEACFTSTIVIDVNV